jgi:broad specificity phosphatase PhoE
VRTRRLRRERRRRPGPYGDYEGLRTVEIRRKNPGWSLFRDGCPGGESVEEVGARADRVIARLRATSGRHLVFGHGHFTRVLAVRWLALPPEVGQLFYLSTASLSILGYEHSLEEPALHLWNDDRHVHEETTRSASHARLLGAKE